MRNGFALWISRTSATSSKMWAISGLSTGSAQNGESRMAFEVAVEGKSVVAPCVAVLPTNQVVGKVAWPGSVFLQSQLGQIPILDLKGAHREDRPKNRADLLSSQMVNGTQDPDQLAEHD